ncbi:FecR family protein [Magnetovibrio sp.]|uniref:FecR family protein n=1 Tax=Magnetovibrio sp. TaxID=2024836 RepID=UPI002F92FE85
MRALLRILAVFGVFAFVSTATAQAQDVIAHVTRLQNAATVERSGLPAPLTMNMALESNDTVATATDARLEITFVDGTTLTLGERARITLDDYVYTPGETANKLAVSVAQGAFLFVSGAMGKQAEREMQVTTQLATIGIRGTTFWGGPLDTPLDVLLLDGKVEVRSPGGAVILDQPGKGTTVPMPGQSPTPPTSWPEDKRQRAFATVAF